MIHISALHGNLILATIGRIAVQHPNELAVGSMSYGQLASNVLSSASNLLSASLTDGMLGGYDLEEQTVTMPGLGADAKVVGLLATWAAGGVGTSSDHIEVPGGLDSPLLLRDSAASPVYGARLAELEMHDAPPRRDGDETVYVDHSRIASWLAELELIDPERKAYVLSDSRTLDVTQDQEEQRRGKPKATYLTHAQVAEMIFSIANNDSNASPRLSQSPLNELDMELFRNMAKLLRGLYSRKDVDPDIA